MTDSARPVAPPRTRRTKWLLLVASIIAIVVVAAGCAFALQYSLYTDWAERPATDVMISPLDTAVIAVLIVAVWSILGRLWWSLGLVAGISLLLAGINHAKIGLRHEPVFPGDGSYVSEAPFMVSMVEPATAVGMLAGVVLVVVGIGAIGWLIGRRYPRARLRREGGGINPRFLGFRIATLVISVGLLIHASQFNQPGNMWRALYDRNATWMPWSQVHNYRSNGFVGGFLYNMPVEAMAKPEGYNAEAMAQVADRYEHRAQQINADRHGSFDNTNVVFILSETFTDPSWMEGFTLDENPIPFTQQVMAGSISGQMYALSYGGGTSTMEFESLTGQTTGLFRPQVSSPYQNFVANYSSYPSAVGAFAEMGHRTVAIHAYNLDMYKRKQVYDTFGFDAVIDHEAMQRTDHIESGRYISDDSAYDEVLYQLDQSEQPDFVNLVTMQNHGTHGGQYAESVGNDIPDPAKAEEYGQYARGLSYSDAALKDFLTALQQRDDRTIVVFYGDHHPGFYTDEMMDREEPDAMFRTPFFVWNSETNQALDVGAVGPSMFLPLLYQAADAPVTPYIALLDEVRRAVPVIQQTRMLDAEGREIHPENVSPQAAALLDDLRLMQFDASIGERYVTDEMWPGALVRD